MPIRRVVALMAALLRLVNGRHQRPPSTHLFPGRAHIRGGVKGQGGNVTRRSTGRAVIAAIAFAGILSGCANKEEYAADTAAATMPPADTASVSGSAAAMADTPRTTTASKPATKGTTTKKAPTKPTY